MATSPNTQTALPSKSQLPFVTLILPIRNEVSYIDRCLNAVLAQDYPSERMEIIIADGMSTDKTRQLIQKFQEQHPNLIMIDNPEQIVPTGLNDALRQARGEIIVRIDGHTEIAPDYVRLCAEALQSCGSNNVGGKMTANGQGMFGEVVALVTSSPFGVGGARFHYSDKEEWVDTVYMGAWRREVFERIGLFDEELIRNQDDEFNYRLRACCGKILLSPKIKSCYTVRSTPGALWRQYFQYGYWKVRVLQKHPRQMRPRQFVPPLFVAALLFSLLLALFHPVGLYVLALVAGSYLLANLVASLWTSAHRGLRHLPLLPLVYAILHMSYGLGFLVGLVKFANRWGDKRGKVPTLENVKSQTNS